MDTNIYINFKRNKISVTNLTKEVRALYNENFKFLKKKTEEDVRKRK